MVCYKQSIEKGDNATAYNNLAWLMTLQKEKPTEALTYINRALPLDPAHLSDYLDTRGVIYLALNQPTNAISDLSNSLKGGLAPSKWFHLAQAYWKDNKADKAKQCLRNAQANGDPAGLHELEKETYKSFVKEVEKQ
jgi:tetratricopeptide (TPR) repeat protein